MLNLRNRFEYFRFSPDIVSKLAKIVDTKISQQGFTYGDNFTQRGTPTSGKTVLSRMLYTHILEQKEYIPIYITWKLLGNSDRSKTHWLSYLCDNNLISEGSFWHQHKVIFVLDEAQLSYQETSFWVECIKSQKNNSSGPRFVLFSSFGSASRIALKIPGSSPIDLDPYQRVSLFPGPHGVSLYFTFEECKDLCKSITRNRGFSVHEDVLQHLFTLTNGHPGLFQGIFKALIDREDIRATALATGLVSLNHASEFFDNDEELISCMQSCIGSSVPNRSQLSQPRNNEMVELLKRAVEKHGVETHSPKDHPGLNDAYKKGYLQAIFTNDSLGRTLYAFPTALHHRMVEKLLFPDSDDGITFSSPKDLCFEALKYFSPTSLASHARKVGRAPGATRPEAQYAYELYRCLYKVTGGKCTIHSEYSYTVEGRIDLFLKKRKWGIEVLKDGDRMPQHITRFEPQGAYGSWKVVSKYIILDFRTKPPSLKRDVAELFHVVPR